MQYLKTTLPILPTSLELLKLQGTSKISTLFPNLTLFRMLLLTFPLDPYNSLCLKWYDFYLTEGENQRVWVTCPRPPSQRPGLQGPRPVHCPHCGSFLFNEGAQESQNRHFPILSTVHFFRVACFLVLFAQLE